jgi:hypothetical protein
MLDFYLFRVSSIPRLLHLLGEEKDDVLARIMSLKRHSEEMLDTLYKTYSESFADVPFPNEIRLDCLEFCTGVYDQPMKEFTINLTKLESFGYKDLKILNKIGMK